MSIPPNGWGAVEMLIWDYYNILTKNGHLVDIVNTPDRTDIINKVSQGNYDVVHLHYDVFSDLMPLFESRVKIISSHYPFINHPDRWSSDGYHNQIFNITNNKDFFIFASSDRDIDTFVKYGADRGKTFLSRLGVSSDSYHFDESNSYDKTLCFSQIVERKRQFLIQDFSNIDFFGRKDDFRFTNLSSYKGEASREFLNKEITKYSNFILLSSVENTTPLAVKEALVCGLGVVVSESVAVELDNLDFISIIKENDINDLDYIKHIIEINKSISIKKRKEIREYGISKFDVESILLNEYIKKIETIL